MKNIVILFQGWYLRGIISNQIIFITMFLFLLGVRPSLAAGANGASSVKASKTSKVQSKTASISPSPSSPTGVDFCSNSSRFDFRNAYWLGTLADYAYLEPDHMIPIISGLVDKVFPGNSIFNKGKNQKAKPINGIGFGSSSVKFYTSATQGLGEGTTNQSENIYNRWITPLPAEACIRPECRECFLPPNLNGQDDNLIALCKKRCGDRNNNAYFEKSKLLSIISKTKASLELNENEKLIKNQVDKYVNKFKTMKKYEGRSLEINGIPIWQDLKTAERCEQYSFNKDVVADTQAYFVENDSAILILFRGTEENNPADLQLDLPIYDLRPFDKKSHMKGAVHEGFYLAHDALKNFVRDSLEESFKKNPNKPVFVTGHSLGGAIGHIAMYSLLTAKKMGFKVNLKAIYTFGAPRVGDKEFGLDYTQKAKEFGVGIYNITNESDVVTHVPCIQYHHAGAMVFFSRLAAGGKGSTKAVYKPNKLNKSSLFVNPDSCGYASMFKNIFSINTMLSEHKMTTYIDRLSDLRDQLRDQKVNCDKDDSSAHFENLKLPENIKLNFQALTADLEN